MDRFVSTVGHYSILTRSILLALSIGALLSLIEPLREALSLTAGQLFTFELWRLLSHVIIERNVFILIWNVYSLHQASTLIEPVWGWMEMGRYLAIVQVLSALLSASIALFCYVAMGSVHFMYHVSIHGFGPGDVAILVAVKQFVPDSIILTTPMGRLKNCHLPMMAIMGCAIAGLIGLLRPIAVLQVTIGTQIAWIYLRFYQPHDNEAFTGRGDVSEHFTWASLFPSYLQPLAGWIGDPLYGLLLRLRLCKPSIRQVDFSQLSSVTVVLPDAETQDAERRRKKALRDLTERLNRASRADTTNWPNMDDEGPVAYSPPATPHKAQLAFGEVQSDGEEEKATERPSSESSRPV